MVLSDRFMPRRPNVISDIIDDEVVIINMLSGAYFSLGQTGALVWQALDAGLTVGQTIELVQQCYDGEPQAMAQAVTAFVAELDEEKLLALRPAGGASEPAATLPVPALGRQPFTAPVLLKYDDMEDLIMLDPIHDVDDSGWPARKPNLDAR
jgi:hypothetical protein